MGNDRNCLKISIQAPGLGNLVLNCGMKHSAKYGKASPKPKAKNINKAINGPCVKAYPIATPMKGAVQGVATNVARTPVKKAPLFPDFPAKFCPTLPNLFENSKKPKRFRPIIKTR